MTKVKPERKQGAKLLPRGTPEEIAEQFRATDNPDNYAAALLTEDEIRGLELPNRKFIVHNLIREESIVIVNGFRGHGKSWFLDCLANEITWGGQLGPWKIDQPCNTLLVDGEMSLEDIQNRLARINIGRAYKHKPCNLFVYAESFAYRIGVNRANILDPTFRDSISEIVRAADIRFLILDNLSSLAPGIDENDKMQFDPVNRWLLTLRFDHVTTAMAHHTGKSGDQRGTSAHEDHVDLSLDLCRPKNYTEDEGCKFLVHVRKDRGFVSQGKQYCLQLTEDARSCLSLATIIDNSVSGAMAIILSNPGMNERDAAEMGIARATFFRAKRKIKEEEESTQKYG